MPIWDLLPSRVISDKWDGKYKNKNDVLILRFTIDPYSSKNVVHREIFLWLVIDKAQRQYVW